MAKHHIIYVPGLGDHRPDTQIKLLKRWQKHGAEVHFFHLGWADSELFSAKLTRLTSLIDETYKQNGRVSLVGVSAGAGAAINGYMERSHKISGVVFICGKILGYSNVNQSYFKTNPAFSYSLRLTQQNLDKLVPKDKAKMLSIKPILDETVPVSATQIPGVADKTIFSFFHVPSIFLALTVYKKTTLNFLKRQSE